MTTHLIKPLSKGRPKGIKTHDAEVAQAFGLVVRKRRIEKGLSQEALADNSGLARTHVGRIERGEMTPLITVVLKLARALEVPSGVLMNDTESLTK